jgi:hypothetical protein
MNVVTLKCVLNVLAVTKRVVGCMLHIKRFPEFLFPVGIFVVYAGIDVWLVDDFRITYL